ncbi:MAG: hypothetical protein HY831_02695 [Candidatus Aenigmarchaeota archaeon]|nr:hypothetical protein [Candidatus Aenigmarchaeota archaeon]
MSALQAIKTIERLLEDTSPTHSNIYLLSTNGFYAHLLQLTHYIKDPQSREEARKYLESRDSEVDKYSMFSPRQEESEEITPVNLLASKSTIREFLSIGLHEDPPNLNWLVLGERISRKTYTERDSKRVLSMLEEQSSSYPADKYPIMNKYFHDLVDVIRQKSVRQESPKQKNQSNIKVNHSDDQVDKFDLLKFLRDKGGVDAFKENDVKILDQNGYELVDGSIRRKIDLGGIDITKYGSNLERYYLENHRGRGVRELRKEDPDFAKLLQARNLLKLIQPDGKVTSIDHPWHALSIYFDLYPGCTEDDLVQMSPILLDKLRLFGLDIRLPFGDRDDSRLAELIETGGNHKKSDKRQYGFFDLIDPDFYASRKYPGKTRKEIQKLDKNLSIKLSLDYDDTFVETE